MTSVGFIETVYRAEIQLGHVSTDISFPVAFLFFFLRRYFFFTEFYSITALYFNVSIDSRRIDRNFLSNRFVQVVGNFCSMHVLVPRSDSRPLSRSILDRCRAMRRRCSCIREIETNVLEALGSR